jgi:hypothetical protein
MTRSGAFQSQRTVAFLSAFAWRDNRLDLVGLQFFGNEIATENVFLISKSNDVLSSPMST